MSHFKKIAGFLISFLFLWLALRKVDWEKIPALVSQARLGLLYLPLIAVTFEQIFRAFRWRVLLKDHAVPIFNLYTGIVFCYFFNNILPARAGEIIRSYYLGRRGLVSTSEAFGSVFLERFLDGLVIVSVLSYSIYAFPQLITGVVRKAFFSAIIFYALILIFMIVLQTKRSLVDNFLHFFLKYLPEHLRERIIKMEDSFIKGFALIRSPELVFKAIIWSYISWFASLLTIWLNFKIWSINLGISELLLFLGVLSIGAMIPSSPGMIGIYQYCCVLVFTDMFGIDKERAVTFGLATHIVSYLYVLLIGSVLLFHENISFKEMSEQAESAEKEKNNKESDVTV
ncbi:MAG: flippase-like domain-containing protein [Candidatus Riflebacteria bacterium]|nr:flippase-like domain-containing protein [Candidatus Riflebacteria bacterium]